MSAGGATEASELARETNPAEVLRPPKVRLFSLVSALSQFGGQAFGIALAVLVSHLIARRLGMTAEADAFFFGRRIATSLIETLSQVMGVFYIPLVAAHADRSGSGFLGATLRHAGLALLAGGAMSLAIAALAGQTVTLLAPGFSGAVAVLAGQTLTLFGAALPATMACIVFAAFLNVTGRFGTPSTLRQMPRAVIALTLAFAGSNIALLGAGAFTLAWFAVGGFMLVHCLLVAARWQPEAEAARPVARAATTGVAAVLLVLGALASTWLETAFAAGLGVGEVTKLELTQRLGSLLGNTLGAALSLVVFAAWSRRMAARVQPTPGEFWRTVVIGLAALVPVQAYVALHSSALVDLVLEHGRFGPEEAESVASSLRWMTLAPLSAFVLRMMLVRVLVDHDLPVLLLVAVGTVCDVVAKLALFSLMTPRLGVVGIVSAQAIAPFVSIALLLVLTHGRRPFLGLPSLGRAAGLLPAVALALAGFIGGAQLARLVAPAASAMAGEAVAGIATLGLSGLVGLALFLLAAKVFHVSVSLD